MRRCVALCSLLALAGSTHAADTVVLTVDASMSSASADVCLNAGALGSDCDTDTSAVSGTITVTFDDAGAPTSIAIDDFDLVFDDGFQASLSSFFWNVSGDVSGGAVYATPGTPTAVAPVAPGTGAFGITDASTQLTGDAQLTGSALGQPINISIDLDTDTTPEPAAVDGTVVVAGSLITITADIEFTSTSTVTDPITATGTVDGVVSLVATGAVPAPACPGDINTTGTTNGLPDGEVNVSDLQFYLNVWQTDLGFTKGSAADVNTTGTSNGLPDGEVNISDLQFYLNLWQTGLGICP